MGCGASKPEPAENDVPPAKANAPPDAPPPQSQPAAAPPQQNAADQSAEAPKKRVNQRRQTQTQRRIAISAEMSTIGDDLAKAVVYPKTDEEKDQIAKALHKHPLFEALQHELILSIVDSMPVCKVKAGDSIIKQGEPGDQFYVVTAGDLSAYIEAAGDEAVAEFKCGDSFGELALLYNSPRATTVKASSDAECYSLERMVFRKLVMEHNSKSKHGLEQYLASVPVLQGLEADQRATLANAAEMVEFKDGEYIISLGESADALFLVLGGEVVCHRGDGAELMRLSTGQFFGESAVTDQEDPHRQANVVAVGPVRLASIKNTAFNLVLGSIQEAMNRNFNKKVLDCVEILAPLESADRDKLLDALTEVTYDKGQDVVVQGDKGTSLYFVKSGCVEVIKDGESVATLKESSFFGERSLLTDELTSATVRAADGEENKGEKVVLMTINKEQFDTILGPLQELIERVMKRREEAESGKIKWEDLTVLTLLGEGSFGRVKFCKHNPTGVAYALKCLRKGQIIRYQQVDHIVCEKRVLAMCDHPFILTLAGVFDAKQEVYMLLELVQGGELFSLLRTVVRFEESQCMLYAAMVTCAFGYLHARKIAHRDLKPENLLFDREGYLKLVDFGFAKIIKDRTWTLCGTPEYLAPEIISNKGHNVGADWWTLGILLYEMLVGHPPFVGESQIETYHKIMRGKYKIPQNFPRNAKDIISRLLVHTPAGRLGCWKNGTRDVTSHEFYKGLNWNQLESKSLPMPHVPPLKGDDDTSCFDDFPEEDNSSWDKYNDQSTYAELWKNEFT